MSGYHRVERRSSQPSYRRVDHHDGRFDCSARRSSRISLQTSPTRLRARQPRQTVAVPSGIVFYETGGKS